MGAAISVILGVPAGLYLLLKPKSPGAPGLVEVASLDQLEEGIPQEVVYYRTRVDGWEQLKEKTTAWVVKKSDDEAIAFHPACPHLGCIYHWEYEAGKFECPCHASAFSSDGEVLEGPAPRGLDRLVTRIESGMLLIGDPEEEDG